MDDGKVFHTAVITPEGVLTEVDVDAVKFPAHDGLMGVLTHRAPILTKLGTGTLTLESGAGDVRYFISGGYAQMKNNVLTILPNEALAVAAITPALLEKEKAKLQEASGALTSDMTKRQTLEARVQAMEHLLTAKV
jgi:F-type H+-transporting ATPase subunit epsilon